MPKGKIKTSENKEPAYPTVDDVKIRQSLILMTDKYNEQARDIIKNAYQDKKLLKKYQKIRESGKYQSGGDSKVHRKIVEFPNGHVFDFVDTILTARYGDDWLYDNKALKHELVRPWWVIKSI